MKKFIGYYGKNGELRVLVDLPEEKSNIQNDDLPETYVGRSSDKVFGDSVHEMHAQ